MSQLSPEECIVASDAFLSSLFGDEIYKKWQELKKRMNFMMERDYVNWLMDLAYQVQISGVEGEVTSQSIYESLSEEGDKAVRTDNGVWSSSSAPTTPSLHDTSAGRARSSGLAAGTAHSKHNHSSYSRGKGGRSNFELTFPAAAKWSMITESSYAMSDIAEVMESHLSNNTAASSATTILHEGDYIDATSVVDESGIESLIFTDTDGSDRKTYRCSYCSHMAHRKSNIVSHIREVHLKLKKIACQHCSALFSRKGHLKDHLVFKHGYKSEHVCPSCHKAFPTPSKLAAHHKHSPSHIMNAVTAHAIPPPTHLVDPLQLSK